MCADKPIQVVVLLNFSSTSMAKCKTVVTTVDISYVLQRLIDRPDISGYPNHFRIRILLFYDVYINLLAFKALGVANLYLWVNFQEVTENKYCSLPNRWLDNTDNICSKRVKNRRYIIFVFVLFLVCSFYCCPFSSPTSCFGSNDLYQRLFSHLRHI